MRSFPLHLYLKHFSEQHWWFAVHGLLLGTHMHFMVLLTSHTAEQQSLAVVQLTPRLPHVVLVDGGEVGGTWLVGPGQVDPVISMLVTMAVLSV